MENNQNGEASASPTLGNSSTGDIQQPKFYKIIISQHECTCLSIPVPFASRYCKNMQSSVYLEVPDGEVWEVEVVHSKSQIWLTKGWQDFTDYYSISRGHFLMFGYNGGSHFSVTIFDMSASEIEYPYNAAHVTRYEQERGQIESDDLHYLSEESSEDDHKQQCKIVYDKNKRVLDKEKAVAYQRANAFKSENPFIKCFMQPSYVSKPYTLSVPFKFARRYFLENCGDLVLRIPGRGSWSVKCRFGTMKANICSGWKAFVLDNKLKFGDVCVLDVIEGTKLIDVTILPGSGSVPCSRSKIVHTKKLKQQTGCSYGFSSKIKEEYDEGTEIEEPLEIWGHCRLRQGSKRRRPEEEAEDDVSIDIRTKSIEVDESREDETAPSFTRKTKKSGESSRTHEQKSKTGNDKSKKVMEKGKAIAYQIAKDFKSENPFFISLMKPSYLSRPYDLYVPREFARKYLLENCDDLVLRILGKGSWSVKCTFLNSKIRSGWKAFVLDNKLKPGDVCLFEVIEGTKLIDVNIFPAAGSTPVHNLAGREVPAVSDHFVPCSQSKLLHTEKLKKWSGSSYDFNSRIKEEYGEGTEIENAVEILGHCPLGQGSERTRPEKEAGDDISIDIHTKRIKVEESQEDEASPSFARKTKKSRKSSRTHKQQSKISKMILGKERFIAYRRAKDFKSNNPFIIYFMQPSYISPPYVLTVWTTFAQKYFLHKDCEYLVLRVTGMGSWPVRCTISKNAKFLSGWKAFVLENKLKTGDVCVFEVIEATKLIDVTIFPAGMRGVSDSVPCTQSKMVHAEKSKQSRGGSYGFNSKNKEYDEVTEIEEPVETLGQCPVGQGSKRKRARQEAEDDVSIDNHTKGIKVEESQEDEASPSFERKTKMINGGKLIDVTIFPEAGSTSMHTIAGREVPEESCSKHSVTAYQRAMAFTSENPFFMCSMRPSYVSSRSLTIPWATASKIFPARHNDLVVQVPDKRSWSLRCTIGPKNAKVISGWNKFVLGNNIKVGDVCVFEQVCRSKLLFSIIIFRAEGVQRRFTRQHFKL